MKKVFSIGLLVLLLSFFAVFPIVLAQPTPPPSQGIFGIELKDPIDPSGPVVFDIIENIIRWAFGFLLVISVLFIIWAAFLFLTSGGEEDKIKSAKRWIIYAVWAIVIGAVARVIVAITRELLGIS